MDELTLVDRRRELALHRDDRIEREIGVDRLGAVTGEKREVMDLHAGFARFRSTRWAGAGSEALADQVMVHGRRREQRGNGDAVAPHFTVGQHDDVVVLAGGETLHRLFGLRAQMLSSAVFMPAAPSATG